jgi:membrane protein YdbS with pleckstrin-like domain
MPDVFVSGEGKKKVKKNPAKHKFEEVREKNVKKLHVPFWATYGYYPENVKFVNQEPEEKIILFLRRHLITNVGWILLGILMFFAPVVLSNFPILEFLPENFQTVAILIWYLVTTAFVFEKFLDWFFDVNIITDERVIDVDFVNMIYREITDANTDKIQDVTVKMGGVIRSIFNYGSILIQTAAEMPLIEFTDIPNPDKVSRLLRDLRVEEEQEKIEGRVR